jgi:DNA recombination-dependent growth factor C
MGLASRSVSIFRYRVRGDVEGPFWETVEEGIKGNAFRETQSSGDVVGMGWTSLNDFADTRFERTPYVVGNYVALSFRIDTIRIAPRILEMHVKAETRYFLAQTEQKRLSAAQSRELKESVKERLTRQALPSIQIYDLMWDTATGTVYLGTHSPRARERVEEYFKKSFGPTLVPLIPYVRAEELLEGKSDRRLLEDLRPASMLS